MLKGSLVRVSMVCWSSHMSVIMRRVCLSNYVCVVELMPTELIREKTKNFVFHSLLKTSPSLCTETFAWLIQQTKELKS